MWAVLLLLTVRLVFGASNGNYKGLTAPLTPLNTLSEATYQKGYVVGGEYRGNNCLIPTQHSESPLGENLLGQDSLVGIVTLDNTTLADTRYFHTSSPKENGLS